MSAFGPHELVTAAAGNGGFGANLPIEPGAAEWRLRVETGPPFELIDAVYHSTAGISIFSKQTALRPRIARRSRCLTASL